jgi:hypothetical protein
VFEALYALQKADLLFEVSAPGKSFRQRPGEFQEAETRLAKRIVHAAGYVPEQVRSISPAKHIARYDWQTVIDQYDRAIQSVANKTRSGRGRLILQLFDLFLRD